MFLLLVYLFVFVFFGYHLTLFGQVCKGTEHEARFQGATYIDCPRIPCFSLVLYGVVVDRVIKFRLVSA